MQKTNLKYTLIALILLLVSACSTDTPTPTTEPDPTETTVMESEENVTETEEVVEAEEDARGVLRIPHWLTFNGSESLDPASPVEFTFVSSMLYDRLVGLAEDGSPEPSLATEWTANEDATEWTFTLRDDVTFHDGQAMTSADVVYTFEHLLDPATEAPAAATLGLIDGVEAPAPDTAVFQLAQGHADFPLLLTSRFTGIVPADSADTIGETGIGSGPFKLESLDVEGTTVLVANDTYWQGQPGLASIELPAISDSDARSLALQSGQIDLVLEMSATQSELFADNDSFTILRFPSGKWPTLAMRTDVAPFDDVRVRQAMRMVADRQQMIDLIVNGAGTPSCDTPVAPTDVYRWEGDCPQDIEAAKALLADAGYADGIDVTLFATDAFPELIPLAEVYQQQAAAADINITLEIAPSDSFWTDVWLVESFYTSLWFERAADNILNLVWRSTADWNESNFQNPEFDQLLDDARRELDFETRRDLYRSAQQLIYTDGGSLIPFHVDNFHIMSAELSGMQARDFQHIDWHKISKGE